MISDIYQYISHEINITRLFYKQNFYKKISLKNPKTLRKY